MTSFSLIDFPIIGDERGSLIALETRNIIPFDVKRIYYIFDTKPGVSRGFHAHRNLKQVMVCVSGKCRILLDDGKSKINLWLGSPSKALLIEGLIWREMHDFSPDCVLVVMASEYYDESDYIRNYSDFEGIVHG
ncbi:WxcM-like domain-containing protein [Pseudomonas sp. PDM12]|uniref:sugar 3,4-ketoisomerase n=1 Tax=Pseudomonas sp. PDM12 TaxID=2769260 RepID=UPI00177F4DE4|nr:FdtA/QdtA family cupin domain-containing protein [Pseudomonas sp. PDM12]MBD9656063.1 WxcM-like domain-containing protein [Pseudomonas sp. PDM12]